MRVGDPDGYGRYGYLDTDDDGLLVCHECGAGWRHLATHARLAHGVPADQYRQAHGLPLTIPLVAKVVRDRMMAAWEKHRDAHLAALAASRDPDRARAHVRPQAQWPPATRAKRARDLSARRGRALTEEEMHHLGDDLPMDEWCRRARALLAADPSVSKASISRSFGRSDPWVNQRLRRYPADDESALRPTR